MRPYPPAPLHQRSPVLVWLRDSFATGVALVLPFAVTAWLLWQFVRVVDATIKPLAPPLWRDEYWIPGVGLVFALVALVVLGALLKGLLGRLLIRASEAIIQQLPVVRSIYGGAKQIFSQVAAQGERTSFKEAVLVPFPTPGSWALGFVTNDDTAEITGKIIGDIGAQEDPLVAVYVPQAPIPTSGFLIYFHRSALRPVSLGPEEALKRVISLGIIRDEAEPGAAPPPTL